MKKNLCICIKLKIQFLSGSEFESDDGLSAKKQVKVKNIVKRVRNVIERDVCFNVAEIIKLHGKSKNLKTITF